MARADRRTPEDEPGERREPGPRDRAEAVGRQREMHKQLRDMFDKIVDEPLPDEMSKLLDEIGRSDDDTTERKGGDQPKDGSR
ncbi:MAG: hypothetical protein GC206_05100 [Alphaproteobacteria bacterium]|nr:hypothetical protein [Alphaproteobacteria bacterium]